jgi:hypothetical protein
VTELVVDLLEVVDVEHHHRQRAARALGSRQLAAHGFPKGTAVREPGQRVGRGQVTRALQLGHLLA